MRYVTVFMILVFLVGCTDKKKLANLEEEHAQLETEYRLLVQESEQKDQFIEEYAKTINTVYDNLEHIRKREGLLSKMSENMEKAQKITLKEKLLHNISSIDEYLQDTRRQLKSLKEKMYTSRLNSASLEERIDDLNRIIDEKEAFIVELKRKVDDLNARVVTVESELQEKSEVIELQTARLNTAYYIIGNEKELKSKGIIEEKGGILGIRKTKKLASNFNTRDFIAADMTEMSILDIERGIKKIKLISPHHPDSYDLVKQDDSHTTLEILDPDTFWKIKYLVILIKG